MEEQEKILYNAGEEENGEAIPVKVRQTVKDSMKRASLALEESAAAKEMLREGEKPKRRLFDFNIKLPPQYRRPPRPAPADLSENEKMWASLAHGSALLTIAIGISTGGIGALFTLFIPLGIYLYFRQQSEYVARHALQAFAAQVVGVVGFFILFLITAIVWGVMLVVSFLLIFVLVGILLFPVVLIAGILALGATTILPLGMLVYSMIAAVESFHGKNYSYPWIGDWVDDQLHSGLESV